MNENFIIPSPMKFSNIFIDERVRKTGKQTVLTPRPTKWAGDHTQSSQFQFKTIIQWNEVVDLKESCLNYSI